MALTDAQKADIRWYLGYSARFYQSFSRLEQAMSALENDPDAETLVLAAIDSVKLIDTKLVEVHDRLKAVQVCDIKLGHKKELCALRGEGRRFVGRIAATLGVPVMHDVFGSGSYRSWATSVGPVPGLSNAYKHG